MLNGRRFTRFGLDDCSVYLRKSGWLPGRKNLAKSLLNLGSGGAGMRLNRDLAEGTRVLVRIELPRFGDKLRVEGVIRWSRRNKVGVEFLDLDDDQAARIRSMKRWFTSKECRQKRGA